MSDFRASFPNAPAAGTVICASADVLQGSHSSCEVEGFPLLLVRHASGLSVYVNACPHQFLPLDYRGKNLLSADGTKLICTNHSAIFDAASGFGMGGSVKDCALTKVPHHEADGQVILGDPGT